MPKRKRYRVGIHSFKTRKNAERFVRRFQRYESKPRKIKIIAYQPKKKRHRRKPRDFLGF